MKTPPDPHNVREFVRNLAPGTRVIWIANRAKGTVQADKTILWDDGSVMTTQQMNDAHALLIHSEAEWQRVNQSLTSALNCVRCGCTVQRWDKSHSTHRVPDQVCPLAVLSDPDEPLAVRPRFAGSVRLAPPRVRPPMRGA